MARSLVHHNHDGFERHNESSCGGRGREDVQQPLEGRDFGEAKAVARVGQRSGSPHFAGVGQQFAMASRAIANRADETSTPTEDLAMFTDKRLVILGGFGTSGGLQGNQQWKSMWCELR